MGLTIYLHNTLSGSKEEFKPAEPGRVRMYVCGPTVYNYIHLGNARPLVFFDTVRRYLAYRGYQVTYVQNFTDIDDKIIRRAEEEGCDAAALANRYIDEYFRDAETLGVRQAEVHPRVSQTMPEILDLVRCLLERGYAYQVEGDVYFEVRSFPGYGKLSGRSPESLRAGARVEVDERKRDPLDFALWKAAKPGEPFWESPWGKGRPGWHIECSAMALKYLGPAFDIHGGGADLVFPHHENEIAQAECSNGQVFARYWLHNGFITVNREKMSKSLGNFFLVREILERYPGAVMRFYLLSTHYRSPLDFDDQKLSESGRALGRLQGTLDLLREALARPAAGEGEPQPQLSNLANSLERARAGFEQAMDDDLNTALALAALFDLSREANQFLHTLGPVLTGDTRRLLEEVAGTYQTLGGEVLGVLGTGVKEAAGADRQLLEGLVELLLAVRQEARQRKDFATSDRIRDQLGELGIILEDTPAGVRWRRRG